MRITVFRRKEFIKIYLKMLKWLRRIEMGGTWLMLQQIQKVHWCHLETHTIKLMFKREKVHNPFN